MERDLPHLIDIWQATKKVSDLTQNVAKDGFLQDEMRYTTVIYQLIIVGEATKRLSDDFRAQNPGIPWKEMAGMRDVLIHSYHDVDLELVWEAATQSIPNLIPRIESLLPPSDE